MPAALPILLWLACTLAWAPLAGAAEPVAPPTIRLRGAELDAVKALAVDTALSRGWVVRAAGAGGIQLEQATEIAAPDTGKIAYTLIRVHAELVADGEDVVIALRAEQVEAPGTAAERSEEVTDLYRANLQNALAALQGRWETSLTVPDSAPAAPPAEAAGSADQAPLGAWAYYAEQYAAAHGCRLGDAAASLVSAGADIEVHRVPCQNGQAMLIRCHLGECAAAH